MRTPELKNDLTEGSLTRAMLRFTIPLVIANILQSLYGAVDLFVIGKYCSVQSVAAVATGTQVTEIITCLMAGLTTGSTILIGGYIGSRDRDSAKRAIGTTFSAFFVVSLFLTAVMLLFGRDLLTVLGTRDEAFRPAWAYISVCALGNVFICEYNAVSAVLRGCGDSERPMLFVAVACVFNIFLDVLFVKYFHLDVVGTALATVLSQGISMILSLIYLRKHSFLFDFRLRSFRPDRRIIKRLARIGIPISFQSSMVRISFLYITTMMNNCGVAAEAIVGIGAKYDVFAMLTSTSMADGLTAMTAQNIGAGKPRRARQALWRCLTVSVAVSSVFFLWAQLNPESMIRAFYTDPEVIRTGVPYFRTCSYDYLMTAFVFCLNGYLNGRQKTGWTMVSTSLGALLLRIPLTWYVSSRFTGDLGRLGMVAPAVSAIMAAYTLAYVLWEGRHSVPGGGGSDAGSGRIVTDM